MPCASFSTLDGPSRTGCNVPVRSCWDSRDVIVGAGFDCVTTNPHKKIAKSFKKLEYNIAYTTNNTLKRHLTNKTTHYTNTKNTHPQVYTNLNVMAVPNTTLVK